MYLIFDTETTGLPKRWNSPISDTDNWPRCIQIAWQLHDAMGNCIENQDYLIQPDGFNIPYDAEKIHGISTELAQEQGVPLTEVLEKFNITSKKETSKHRYFKFLGSKTDIKNMYKDLKYEIKKLTINIRYPIMVSSMKKDILSPGTR